MNEIIEEEEAVIPEEDEWKYTGEWERTTNLKHVFHKYYNENGDIQEFPVLYQKWINIKNARIRWTEVVVKEK